MLLLIYKYLPVDVSTLDRNIKRWYYSTMNDCITNLEDAVKDRLVELGFILTMLVLVLCLVAPILDPVFKHHRRRAHIMNAASISEMMPNQDSTITITPVAAE